MVRVVADLWSNLGNGFALALLRRRERDAFRCGVDQLFALLLFTLLLELAVDYINHQPTPSFNHYALATFGLKLLLFTLAAYLISLAARQRDGLLIMVTVFYSTMLPFALFEIAIRQGGNTLYALSPEGYSITIYLYLAWLMVIAARAAQIAFAGGRRLALLATAIVAVVWVLPLRYGDWDNSFWEASYPQPEDQYAAYRAMDAEALLYAQPQMVERTLAQLAPQRPGVSDLYFVSFGAYAYQDVFMKEVDYAGKTMAQHFDTAGHSISLVNNLQTRDSLPLASVSNLRAVLKRLASVMDEEEDVLMLYLTSHGSEQHELAVEFWPLPLNDITPQRLRALLDEVGIQWRVVVVSACYSGGFVEALRDAHTLVATAAAADRQSFGCDNDNDFTYFGEALFRDNLAKGEPLLEAFNQTRGVIAERERRERLEPSLPQLYVGPLIEEKLQGLAEPSLNECGDGGEPSTAVGC